MGIHISVESIIRHPTRRNLNGPYQIQELMQRAKIGAIQRTFGLSELSWEEPSSIEGFITTSSFSRWAAVQRLAFAIEVQTATGDLDLQEVVYIMRNGNHGTRFLARYRHLLQHDIYNAYWLPFGFDSPKLVSFKYQEAQEYRNYFSVGSTQQLIAELIDLRNTCASICDLVGSDTLISVDDPNPLSWGKTLDLCVTLNEATLNSEQLNLPMEISW